MFYNLRTSIDLNSRKGRLTRGLLLLLLFNGTVLVAYFGCIYQWGFLISKENCIASRWHWDVDKAECHVMWLYGLKESVEIGRLEGWVTLVFYGFLVFGIIIFNVAVAVEGCHDDSVGCGV